MWVRFPLGQLKAQMNSWAFLFNTIIAIFSTDYIVV
jgi:hypothetical protein